jgi:hypothetical protein
LLALTRAVNELGKRLARVEERLGMAPTVDRGVDAEHTETAPASHFEGITVPQAGLLALTGRTLLALAGGYLLRALADGEVLSPSLAVFLGLLYAALWILAADRAAARDRPRSAGFHATAAALIGFPLLWETTRVFQLLAPEVAAAALGGLMLLMLATAWRHDHPAPVWLATLGGALVALLLLRLAPVPFAALLLLYGGASLWAATSRGWNVVPWVSAGAANLGVLLAMVKAPGETVILQLALFLVYAGAFAAISLLPARPVGALGFFQMPAVLALGYVAPLVAADPTLRLTLGSAGIAAGAAAYVSGLRGLDRSRRRDLAYLSFLGLLLLLAGSAAALPRAPAAWAALALAATLIGRLMGRLTLTLHGAFFALAAAAGSGLLTTAAHVWAAPASSPWPPPGFAAMLALVVALLCLAVSQPGGEDHWQEGRHLPRLILLSLVVFGGGAAMLQGSSMLAGGLSGPVADAAILSVARTATLAALALGLAWLSRWSGHREPYWLVFALLALGGLKLLGEDLLQGRPATLVLSLTLYGTALITAPRLGRPA